VTEDGRKIVIAKSNRRLMAWEVETEDFIEIDTLFGDGDLSKSNIGCFTVLPNDLLVVANIPGDSEPSVLRIFSLLDSSLQREIKINHRLPDLCLPQFVCIIDKTQFFTCYNHKSGSINYLIDSNSAKIIKEISLTEQLSSGVAVTPHQLMAPGRGLLYSISLETGQPSKNLPIPLDEAPQIFFNGIYIIAKSKQVQLFIER